MIFICENNRAFPSMQLVSVLIVKLTIMLSLCFVQFCQWIFYGIVVLNLENKAGATYSEMTNMWH